jgi:menaquinone-dependent protoporphyrinogen IX oxidase
MRKLLVCPKQSGNTFMVCDYVSKHADIDLKFTNELESFQLDEYKTIILCSGVYIGKAHINLTKWLENISNEQIVKNTKFYMFMTWFGRGNSDQTVLKKIDSDLKRIDAKLEDNYTTCFGQGMGVIRSGHPDNTDFEKILTWVNNL